MSTIRCAGVMVGLGVLLAVNPARADTFSQGILNATVISARVTPSDEAAFYVVTYLKDQKSGRIEIKGDGWECIGELSQGTSSTNSLEFILKSVVSNSYCVAGAKVGFYQYDESEIRFRLEWKGTGAQSASTYAVKGLVELARDSSDGNLAVSSALPTPDAATMRVNIENLNYWDSWALALWSGKDLNYVSQNVPITTMENKFDEKRNHESLVADVLSRFESFRAKFSNFHFEFIDIKVDIGEYDFDTNRQVFCVPKLVNIVSPYEISQTYVQVYWNGSDTIGRCDGSKVALGSGNSVSNGGYLTVGFDNQAEGEAFDRIIRASGAKISFFCGSAEARGYSGLELICVPYDVRLMTLDNQLLFSTTWSNGGWIESNPHRKPVPQVQSQPEIPFSERSDFIGEWRLLQYAEKGALWGKPNWGPETMIIHDNGTYSIFSAGESQEVDGEWSYFPKPGTVSMNFGTATNNLWISEDSLLLTDRGGNMYRYVR